jgi:hypothetical protein
MFCSEPLGREIHPISIQHPVYDGDHDADGSLLAHSCSRADSFFTPRKMSSEPFWSRVDVTVQQRVIWMSSPEGLSTPRHRSACDGSKEADAAKSYARSRDRFENDRGTCRLPRFPNFSTLHPARLCRRHSTDLAHRHRDDLWHLGGELIRSRAREAHLNGTLSRREYIY